MRRSEMISAIRDFGLKVRREERIALRGDVEEVGKRETRYSIKSLI